MVHLTLTWTMLWKGIGHFLLYAAGMFLLDFYFERRFTAGERGHHFTTYSMLLTASALFLVGLVLRINGSF